MATCKKHKHNTLFITTTVDSELDDYTVKVQQEEVVKEQEHVEHIEPTYVITLQVFMYSVCVESVRFCGYVC